MTPTIAYERAVLAANCEGAAMVIASQSTSGPSGLPSVPHPVRHPHDPDDHSRRDERGDEDHDVLEEAQAGCPPHREDDDEDHPGQEDGQRGDPPPGHAPPACARHGWRWHAFYFSTREYVGKRGLPRVSFLNGSDSSEADEVTPRRRPSPRTLR